MRKNQFFWACMFFLGMIIAGGFVYGGGHVLAASDVPSNHWAYLEVQKWTNAQLATGYPDGSFQPKRALSRAEWVTWINRAFVLAEAKEQALPEDVPEQAWYAAEFRRAMRQGIVQGDENGAVRPRHVVTRQEAALTLARLMRLDLGAIPFTGTYQDGQTWPVWSQSAIAATLRIGWMQGYPDRTFRPRATMTRAEALFALNRVLLQSCQRTSIPSELQKNCQQLYDVVITKTESKPSDALFDQKGVYGVADTTRTITGDAWITADGVELVNTEVQGNVVITPSVGTGSVVLRNVTAKGDVIIRGGGENSVYLYGTKVTTIAVEDTPYRSVRVRSDTILPVVIRGDTQRVILDGMYGDVRVEGTNMVVVVENKATIASIAVQAQNENTLLEVKPEAIIQSLVPHTKLFLRQQATIAKIEKTENVTVVPGLDDSLPEETPRNTEPSPEEGKPIAPTTGTPPKPVEPSKLPVQPISVAERPMLIAIPTVNEVVVEQGTLFETIILPPRMTVTLKTGEVEQKRTVAIVWDRTTYRPDVVGQQVIRGALQGLPEDVLNPNQRVPTVNVKVLAKEVKPAEPISDNNDQQTERTFSVRTSFFGRDSVRSATAQRLMTTQEVDIWVEKKYVQKEEEMLSAVVRDVATQYADKIRPLITKYFYAPSDIDKNGKIALFIGDMPIEPLEYSGYFSPEDLYPKQKHSNKMEVLFLSYSFVMQSSRLNRMADVYLLIAHELQHLVNANPKLSAREMDVWLNEALSLAAEHLYATTYLGWQGIPGHIETFNSSGFQIAPTTIVDWNYNKTSYAVSYLFLQYLRTQIEQKSPGNTTFYRELIDARYPAEAAVEKIIKKYIDPKLTFKQWVTYFAQAIKQKQPNGLNGFGGEVFFDALNQKEG